MDTNLLIQHQASLKIKSDINSQQSVNGISKKTNEGHRPTLSIILSDHYWLFWYASLSFS